jgi:hypothetical protein
MHPDKVLVKLRGIREDKKGNPIVEIFIPDCGIVELKWGSLAMSEEDLIALRGQIKPMESFIALVENDIGQWKSWCRRLVGWEVKPK